MSFLQVFDSKTYASISLESTNFSEFEHPEGEVTEVYSRSHSSSFKS